MTSDVKLLLPLPKWVNPGYRNRTIDYARACVEARTEALRIENERLVRQRASLQGVITRMKRKMQP